MFKGWFSLKPRCPHCDVKFEPEDGYLIGSYVINIGLTAVAAIAILIYLMVGTDLSTVTIQLIALGLAILLPVFLYPFTQLLWITLDLLIRPPHTLTDRYR